MPGRGNALRRHRMPALSLRSATAGDLALTYAITEEAMRGHVEATWGRWDADEEFRKHQRNFTPQTHRIILMDDREAGMLAIEDFPTYTWLVKLYLRAAFRGRGLGSALLQQVIADASALDKPVHLQVLRVNTRAQQLYYRHGFTVAHETPERLFLQRGV